MLDVNDIGPDGQARKIVAYERTADLLGLLAIGTPVHEVLMIAYQRGSSEGYAAGIQQSRERVAA